jgi:hypothetical protein
MENNRGTFTPDNVSSFLKGVWISFSAILITLLPYLEQGLDGIRNNPDTPPIELATAFVLMNFINFVRLYFKS